MAYRIATHPHAPASVAEVLNAMSLDDVVEAHGVLDMIDEQTRRSMPPPESG